MAVEPTNPVIVLCSAGMAVEDNPAEALAWFEQAWNARRDDYDTCIAAHFIARVQRSPELVLHWNEIAVRHAEAVEDDRVRELMSSLYLNFGDANAALGNHEEAAAAAARACASLDAVPASGYRDFLAFSIRNLQRRLAEESMADSVMLAGR
ncbi:MAG: hypothetical protein ABJE10_06855 [bacterium]